jgi:WD40 repeat protein
LQFSPNGTKLAAGGMNGTIDVWDVSALHDLSQLPEPKALASGDARENRGSDTPVAGANGSQVKSSEISTRPRLAASAHVPRLLRTIKAHLHAVRSLTFSTDGTRLASRDSDGVSKLWDWQIVDGRYEVKDMGEELLDGYVAISFENEDGGVVVTEVTSQQEIVSGSIQVGDRITGFSNDLTGPVKDFAGMDANHLVRFVGGDAHNTLFRLRIQSPGEDERHVQLRRSVKLSPRPMQVAFAADRKTLAIAGQRTGSTSLNLATGKTQRFNAFGSSVAISPDGRMLAMDDYYEVLLWDLQLDREHARLKSRVDANPIPGNATGGALAFSSDGKYLALGTGYRYAVAPRSDLKVWQLSDLEEFDEPLLKNDCIISAVAFTPLESRPRLIAADKAGVIRIWDAVTWKLERTINRGSRLYSMAVSPDGRILATGGDDRTVLWDLEGGTRLRVLEQTHARAIAFSPDGRTLVSGNADTTVVLWDVTSGRQLRTFDAHIDSVYGVCFAPDGNTLATSGSEGILRLWEAAPLEEIDRYPGTLDSLFRLGQLRNEQGRFTEAEAILRRSLQLQEKQLPADHADILRTRAELEAAVRGQGEAHGKPPPGQARE